MQQSASDAEANGTEVKAWAEDVLAKIDAFTVPDVSVARVSAEQMASIRGCIQNFEEGLGKCTGFEDAVNLIISQVTQLLGVPSFNVQDIRNFWQSLPGHFDDVDALATRLVARAAVLEREASVQTMPEMAAPAPDPEDEDAEGAGT